MEWTRYSPGKVFTAVTAEAQGQATWGKMDSIKQYPWRQLRTHLILLLPPRGVAAFVSGRREGTFLPEDRFST